MRRGEEEGRLPTGAALEQKRQRAVTTTLACSHAITATLPLALAAADDRALLACSAVSKGLRRVVDESAELRRRAVAARLANQKRFALERERE